MGMVCEGCLERLVAEGRRALWRLSDEHALYRDEAGVWQLRDDAELL